MHGQFSRFLMAAKYIAGSKKRGTHAKATKKHLNTIIENLNKTLKRLQPL